MTVSGPLTKMKTSLADGVAQYWLRLGDQEVEMNALIGKNISLTWSGVINCIRCGRVTKKSFAQGYCYPCFRDAPETESCILRPETCQAHEGISRDMEWSKNHCLQDHYVYFAVSSGLKVGVTRATQIPTRWIDQGADRAIIVARTPNRFTAGTIEVALKKHFNDKTNWRRMLTNNVDMLIDLLQERDKLKRLLGDEHRIYLKQDFEIMKLSYPVEVYPEKVKSNNFEKTKTIAGQLTGIKGQYLFFDHSNVINIRAQGGYNVDLSWN